MKTIIYRVLQTTTMTMTDEEYDKAVKKITSEFPDEIETSTGVATEDRIGFELASDANSDGDHEFSFIEHEQDYSDDEVDVFDDVE